MQASFSDLEYASKRKLTRRDRFLAQLEAVTPWSALVAAIAPFYPKGEGPGRPPIGLERMLRMVVTQQCFGLSDDGIRMRCMTARPSATASVSIWPARRRRMPPRC